MLKSRPATRRDILKFLGKIPHRSIRARVIEEEGEIIGMAGYYLVNGVAVMFSESNKPIPKMTIWRESKAMMEGLRFSAVCTAEDNSGPFLQRLGWVYAGPSPDGDVYTWQQ